jgi:hypothetical protein
VTAEAREGGAAASRDGGSDCGSPSPACPPAIGPTMNRSRALAVNAGEEMSAGGGENEEEEVFYDSWDRVLSSSCSSTSASDDDDHPQRRRDEAGGGAACGGEWSSIGLAIF